MWIQQLLHTLKTRREHARWLKRERAVRLEFTHLSDHIRKDIGLTNLGSTPSLRWRQAPVTQISSAKKSLRTLQVLP